MFKKGIRLEDLDFSFTQGEYTTKWTLCIGAGTSTPIFPSWDKLINILIEKFSGKVVNDKIAESLKSHSNYDTLIQASQLISELDNYDFTEILREMLYTYPQKILTEKSDYTLFLKALKIDAPTEGIDNHIWEKLSANLLHKIECSALLIAEQIVMSIKENKAPHAILTFNAESLLYMFCNYFCTTLMDSNPGGPGRKKWFDFITMSISNENASRIPYIFCHGYLPPLGEIFGKKRLTSSNTLVFSENSYLDMANHSFSWQSNTFLRFATSTRLVFIGVSLTDPNMRRWLSWVQMNRLREVSENNPDNNKIPAQHFWINKHPGDEDLADWVEASVANLGVRILWIKDWLDVGSALKLLIGI